MHEKLRWVLETYAAGDLALGEVFNVALDLAGEADLDEVVEAIPADIRADVIEYLRSFVDADPNQLISIWAGSERRPQNAEEALQREVEEAQELADMRRKFREVQQPALRAWAASKTARR
jgi:hypothetical protein